MPQKIKLVACLRVWKAFIKRAGRKEQSRAAALVHRNRRLLGNAWRGWQLVGAWRGAQIHKAAEHHSGTWGKFQGTILRAWAEVCKAKVLVQQTVMTPCFWLLLECANQNVLCRRNGNMLQGLCNTAPMSWLPQQCWVPGNKTPWPVCGQRKLCGIMPSAYYLEVS